MVDELQMDRLELLEGIRKARRLAEHGANIADKAARAFAELDSRLLASTPSLNK